MTFLKTHHQPRVVMIIQKFFPDIGGAERQALELSVALWRKKIVVLVLTATHEKLARFQRVQGIWVRRFKALFPNERWLFFFSVMWWLFWKRNRYDVIHVHLVSSHAIAAALVGKFLRKKVIVKVGGGVGVGEVASSQYRLMGRMKWMILQKLSVHIVMVNKDQKNELAQSKLGNFSISFIPNGVDGTKFLPRENAQKKSLKETLGWSGFQALFVGRFAKDKIDLKAFAIFLETWKMVFKNCPTNFCLRLVGQGPLQSMMMNKVHEFGLDRQIIFMSPTKDIDMLYQAADLFVLLSQGEGISNALLEAMSSGLPVLATRVSGVIDVVEEDKNALLFDPYNSQELQGHLETVRSGSEKLVAMSKRSLDIAQRFSIDGTADRYLEAYAV